MGFRSGSYATVWNVKQEDGKNFSTVELSVSRKDKRTDQYVTDFSSGYVRFIGTAHERIAGVAPKTKIKLGDVDVSNYYDKEKKREFVTYKVFSFDITDQQPVKSQQGSPEVDDDEEPF